MKIALIMRGIPGSGKSTMANQLAGDKGIVHSADDYFGKGDDYLFDPSRLAECHDLNLEAFAESIRARASIVVCDNVNMRRWCFEEYVAIAKEAGYLVAIVNMPHPEPEVAAKRNIHKCPLETIKRMIARWEA